MKFGGLFTEDYLRFGITETAQWASFDDDALSELSDALADIFDAFPHGRNPNEQTTEDDLIWKVLGALGWSSYLRQVNLAVRGRDNVPDGLLFADYEAKRSANARASDVDRYQDGLAIVESKRWNRALD